ncbi:MAG: hypothetical protein FJY82_11485, partial [Candidatus Aminicenantes bacterium]|nr:hypothetical protein [Candidatus Aminicenantes bacterium]
MKRRLVLALFALGLLAPGTRIPAGDGTPSKISPELRRIMAGAKDEVRPLRVWVSFRDKGQKSPDEARRALAEARRGLDERCLRRRAKTVRGGLLVGEEDVPLAGPYTQAVRALAVGLRAESRWFNAVSVEAWPDQVERLAALAFVEDLSPVQGFRRTEEPLSLE